MILVSAVAIFVAFAQLLIVWYLVNENKRLRSAVREVQREREEFLERLAEMERTGMVEFKTYGTLSMGTAGFGTAAPTDTAQHSEAGSAWTNDWGQKKNE